MNKVESNKHINKSDMADMISNKSSVCELCDYRELIAVGAAAAAAAWLCVWDAATA